jgi:carbon-monoxide dehydrogenase large subunit
VRFTGDYVAFVVAESLIQAQDAAELIAVDYEPLPAVVSTAEATAEGAPRVWDQCPDNIGFVQLFGDKAATEAAFANAAHIVKHRFVINRVTAASMEPRGSIGDYNAAEDRYTIYTTLQRAHPFRTELAPILKVPESKIRVITGDIGGSFGMKSAVYNDVALVLLASKRVGRPVKWTSTRSESFLCDAQARDNVTQAELALDRNGIFLGLRVHTIASIGAYLQTGMPAFTGNIGTLAGVYRTPAIHADVTAVFTHTNPVRPYRGNGRPEAAYVIERLVDLAADELGVDPAELRRRNYIPPEAMPFKTGLTFTYDSGEFEKSMDMALALADFAGFERRRAEARKRGKLRGIGLSNTIERAAAQGFEGAEIRFDKSGAVTLLAGSVTQGQGHETIFKQIACDRLGLDPNEVYYIQGDTDQVFVGEGTGGSRSATIGGSAVDAAAERITTKAKAIAAHLLDLEAADINFADGVFSSPKTNRTLTIKDVAKEAMEPTRLPKGMDVGPDRDRDLCRAGAELPQRLPHLRARDRRGHRRSRDRPLQRRGRRRHRHQPAAAEGTDRRRRRARRRPDADGGHQVRRRRPNLTGSFMDYAMPRATDISAVDVKSNPVPTRTNPLGVKGAGEAAASAPCPRSPTRWWTRSRTSASATVEMPADAGADVARHERSSRMPAKRASALTAGSVRDIHVTESEQP